MQTKNAVKVANPFASLVGNKAPKTKKKKNKAGSDTSAPGVHNDESGESEEKLVENVAEAATTSNADVEANADATDDAEENTPDIIRELMALGYKEENIVACKQRLEMEADGSRLIDASVILQELQQEVLASIGSTGKNTRREGQPQGQARNKKPVSKPAPTLSSAPAPTRDRHRRKPKGGDNNDNAGDNNTHTDSPNAPSHGDAVQPQQTQRQNHDKQHNRDSGHSRAHAHAGNAGNAGHTNQEHANGKSVSFAPKSNNSHSSGASSSTGAQHQHQTGQSQRGTDSHSSRVSSSVMNAGTAAGNALRAGDEQSVDGLNRLLQQWDPLSETAAELLESWVFRLSKPSCAEDEHFARVFHNSDASGLIVRRLLTSLFPVNKSGGPNRLQKAVLKLWDVSIAGPSDYHRWLWDSLRRMSTAIEALQPPASDVYIQKIATTFTEQCKFHNRHFSIQKLLQEEESKSKGRSSVRGNASANVSASDLSMADTRMSQEFGINPTEFFGAANPSDPLRKIWDSVVRSYHLTTTTELQFARLSEVMTLSSPHRDLQLQFHYLEKGTKEEIKNAQASIDKNFEEKAIVAMRRNEVERKGREDVAMLEKKESDLINSRKDLVNRKKQLELELANVSQQIARIDGLTNDAANAAKIGRERHALEMSKFVQLNKDVDQSIDLLAKQKVCAEEVTRYVVSSYERLAQQSSSASAKLTELTRSSVSDLLSGLRTHVLNCQDLTDCLKARIVFLTNKLAQTKQERTDLLSHGVNTPHLPAFEEQMAAIVKQYKSVTEKITSQVSKLFSELRRSCQPTAALAGDDVLHALQSMLTAFEARPVIFDLAVLRSLVKTFLTHQQSQQQLHDATSANQTAGSAGSAVPTGPVASSSTTSPQRPLHAHSSRAVQPPEKSIAVNFTPLQASAHTGEFVFSFPTATPTPTPVSVPASASNTSSTPTPPTNTHSATSASSAATAGTTTSPAVSTSIDGAKDQRKRRGKDNRNAHTQTPAAAQAAVGVTNTVQTASANPSVLASSATSTSSAPGHAGHAGHAGPSESIKTAATATAAAAAHDDSNLNSQENKTSKPAGGSWANIAVFNNTDKARQQLEQQARAKAAQATSQDPVTIVATAPIANINTPSVAPPVKDKESSANGKKGRKKPQRPNGK